jgi:HK97 family phage portal protein
VRLLPVVARIKAAVSSMVTTFEPVRSTVIGWVNEPFAGAWQRNISLNPIGTLTANSAVYACTTRISNDIAKLAMKLVEIGDDGIWRPVQKNHPRWAVLRKPNGFQNHIQFLAYWMTCKLLYGNAYALKERDARGIVTKLYIINPKLVTPLITHEGDVYYSLAGDDLSRIPTGMVVPASEIIHDRINCLWHPLVGVPPIIACALSATQAQKIQNNSAKFFENMSRPSGMITAPGTIDPVTAVRLKEEFQDKFGGGNIGKVLVAGDGLKYEAMTMPAEQAQLIEQLKWTVEDTARAFGMPLYKIGAGDMPTNNNVEALNQQYYDDCLQVHIENFEACMDEGLDLELGVMGVELDLDGLLRMDKASQIKMLVEGLKGLYKPNEARARINLPKVEGGDAIYIQEQNYSLSALAKRDARVDPFAKGGAAPPALPPAPAPDPAEDDEEDDAKAFDEILKHLAVGAKSLPALITWKGATP